MKKILMIGSGAIASYYSGLIEKNCDLTIFCRNDYHFVKEHGIYIESPNGNFTFKPKVINNLADYCDQPDYIIIATKSLAEIDLVSMIKKINYHKADIVLIQNGIHIEKTIFENFKTNNLISVLAFVAVSRISSGKIIHQDYGKLIIGNYPIGINNSCEELITILKQSKIEIEVSKNIQEERWEKLIWNGSFNPVSVLTRLNTQQLLANSNIRILLKNIMQEIIDLAKIDGFNLDQSLIDKNFYLTEKMKPYKTSMLLDFEANRPMEIESIIGNAINFAKNNSIKTPYLSSIYALISCY
jgi:2-dehydropantoate 2-reductase